MSSMDIKSWKFIDVDDSKRLKHIKDMKKVYQGVPPEQQYEINVDATMNNNKKATTPIKPPPQIHDISPGRKAYSSDNSKRKRRFVETHIPLPKISKSQKITEYSSPRMSSGLTMTNIENQNKVISNPSPEPVNLELDTQEINVNQNLDEIPFSEKNDQNKPESRNNSNQNSTPNGILDYDISRHGTATGLLNHEFSPSPKELSLQKRPSSIKDAIVAGRAILQPSAASSLHPQNVQLTLSENETSISPFESNNDRQSTAFMDDRVFVNSKAETPLTTKYFTNMAAKRSLHKAGTIAYGISPKNTKNIHDFGQPKTNSPTKPKAVQQFKQQPHLQEGSPTPSLLAKQKQYVTINIGRQEDIVPPNYFIPKKQMPKHDDARRLEHLNLSPSKVYNPAVKRKSLPSINGMRSTSRGASDPRFEMEKMSSFYTGENSRFIERRLHRKRTMMEKLVPKELLTDEQQEKRELREEEALFLSGQLEKEKEVQKLREQFSKEDTMLEGLPASVIEELQSFGPRGNSQSQVKFPLFKTLHPLSYIKENKDVPPELLFNRNGEMMTGISTTSYLDDYYEEQNENEGSKNGKTKKRNRQKRSKFGGGGGGTSEMNAAKHLYGCWWVVDALPERMEKWSELSKIFGVYQFGDEGGQKKGVSTELEQQAKSYTFQKFNKFLDEKKKKAAENQNEDE